MSNELEVHNGLAGRMEYAKATSHAALLPPAFRDNPANVLIAMEIGDALGKRPFMVMQELAIISGKPTFSAKFMRGLVREAGHRLRESFVDGTARAEIVRKDDPDYQHTATWDEAKARQHGYWGKGHWAKNPELMLKNRALSECVREACPEVLGGVAYTPDEVEDFAPPATVHTVVQEPAVSPSLSITDAITEPETEPVEAERVPDFAALVDAMAAAGVDKLEMPGYATSVLGREIESGGDLTADEVDMVVEALTAAATA